MHEDLNQKISQLLDDELNRHETLSLLKKMQSDSDLKDKLDRYGAISHALKTEIFLLPEPDFSAKISQQIRLEPTYLLPKPKPRQFKRSHRILAAAASIAVVSVIVGRGLNFPSAEIQTSSVMQMPVTASSSPLVSAPQSEQYPVNKQINDYLQAHNSSVYINGQANFQPYTRVTAYSQK
jgi:sigma-E factor negative regulatory protein RseA